MTCLTTTSIDVMHRNQRLPRLYFPAIAPWLALTYLTMKGWLPWLPGFSCPIRHLSGVPCPGCFLTRSVSLALTGQLSDSLEYHVLGPPAAAGLIAWAIASLRHRRFYWAPFCNQFLIVMSSLAILVWLTRVIAFYIFKIPSFPAF